MANSKISALTSATTPLAGTETLPVVQSSATTQVSVANLTAGRAVDTGALKATAQGAGIGNTGNALSVQRTANDSQAYLGFRITPDAWVLAATYSSTGAYKPLIIATSDVARLTFATAGDITVNAGNLVQGTAAKGVNFTANTPVAGMTSQLLNWYEEGTWTPNQGAGLTLVGAFSSTGRYTRIGRQVSIRGTVTGATSVAVAAAGVITSNLPFTVVTAGHGGATNVAINASSTVICTSTSVTSAGAIVATGTITFFATYFV